MSQTRVPLQTFEGELLELSVEVPLRQLEGMLEAISGLPFPVNPEIIHPQQQPQQDSSCVRVQFPAYDRRLASVRGSLERAGFAPGALRVRAALD